MTPEQELLASVEAYFARHPEETATGAALRQVPPLGQALLDRTTIPYHWTASAWILDAPGEMALLLFHRKLQRWLQPGGHADGEWNLEAVALREAQEETGLTSLRLDSLEMFDFDVTPIPARGDGPAHAHLDARYLFWADRGEPIVESAESNGVKWVRLGELGNESDSGIRRMAEKTILRKRSLICKKSSAKDFLRLGTLPDPV